MHSFTYDPSLTVTMNPTVTVKLPVQLGDGDTSGPASPAVLFDSSQFFKRKERAVCISCKELPILEHILLYCSDVVDFFFFFKSPSAKGLV